jgi:hypothetical protein
LSVYYLIRDPLALIDLWIFFLFLDDLNSSVDRYCMLFSSSGPTPLQTDSLDYFLLRPVSFGERGCFDILNVPPVIYKFFGLPFDKFKFPVGAYFVLL